MTKRKSGYVPAPEVPPELQLRVRLVLEALAGVTTVTAASRELGLSRLRFQTLMNRALEALVKAVTPHPAGRPPLDPMVRELLDASEELLKENEDLRERVSTFARLLGVANEMLHGRPRGRRTKAEKKDEPGGADEDEPDGAARKLLDKMREVVALGTPRALAAKLLGRAESTLRRWQQRERRREPLVRRRGRGRGAPAPEALRSAAAMRVRDLRGLIGADALRRAVPGISRREGASVKRDVLTQMERERKAACTRVLVTEPGAVRALDELFTRDGRREPALAIADAAVPYRTTLAPLVSADAECIAELVDRDFREHGAPLVLRMDRASAHRAPPVDEVLRRHRVLALHGPPRHPGYYGQLERQNREHRVFVDALTAEDRPLEDAELERIRRMLNTLWPRRALGWRTPEELWQARKPVLIDRVELRDEVEARAARLALRPDVRAGSADMAMRLAIEQALERRGLIRQIACGWC